MKLTRIILPLIVLALPATAAAQAGAGSARPDAKKQDKTHDADSERAMVKGHVLPMVVGSESATLCAAALHELATGSRFDRADARQTARLAEYAIELAHDRAKRLGSQSWLSQESRADLRMIASRLAEARTNIRAIRKHVDSRGRVQRGAAGKIEQEVQTLHARLMEARGAIDKVAGVYNIPTKLGMTKISSAR